MKTNISKTIVLILLSAFIFACSNSEKPENTDKIVAEAKKMQAEAAEKKRDEAAWQVAENQNTITSYEVYLSDNRNQIYRKEATQRKSDLEIAAKAAVEAQEKARDESAWQAAESNNTVAAYEVYLSDNRNQIYRTEASKRKSDLEKAAEVQACQCSPKTFRSVSDHTWVEFRLPKAAKNKVIRIKGGAHNKYVFPKCNRVYWSNLTFKCNPSSCRWQRTSGNWDADALCHGSKGNSPYVFVGAR